MRTSKVSATRSLFRAGLVVLIAVTGLPLPASAVDEPQDAERYVFYLAAQANRTLDDLCVGDVVRIDVKAERFQANQRGADTSNRNTTPPVQVYGVTIDGTVGNPEVGALFFTRRITSYRRAPPGTASFKFTATKAGTTGIAFKGTHIQSGWFLQFARGTQSYLSTELEVKVSNCDYSVTATSAWDAFNLHYKALVSDVRMASSDGVNYSGSGPWTLMITRRGECANTQVYKARVELTGTVDGDQLIVSLTYGRPVGNWIYHPTFDCRRHHSTSTLHHTGGPLEVIVPVTGNASVTLPHTLEDWLVAHYNAEGSATVTVTRLVPE
jgi:hypothetical protein